MDGGVFGGVEAKLQAAGGALFGPHGNGHQQQARHLIRVVQRVLQRHAGAEGEPGQHQPAGMPSLMQPVPQPLGIPPYVGEGLTFRVAGKVGGQGIGETLHLMVVRRGATACARPVEQD